MFNEANPRIDHLVCDHMPERTGKNGNPEKLNSDTYIVIYRKQQAALRHHIYMILKETGGKSMDPAV